jgi:hypothetical protein
MLESSRVASQLAASQEVLISMELVSLLLHILILCFICFTVNIFPFAQRFPFISVHGLFKVPSPLLFGSAIWLVVVK